MLRMDAKGKKSSQKYNGKHTVNLEGIFEETILASTECSLLLTNLIIISMGPILLDAINYNGDYKFEFTATVL